MNDAKSIEFSFSASVSDVGACKMLRHNSGVAILKVLVGTIV